jgi:hypothetical protein
VTSPIPLVTQYGTGAVFCGRSSVGCAVAATASFILRYGVPIPRTGGRPDLVALGASMADRHRARDPKTPHGVCPRAWCAFCAYLELKARSIPVAYGKLSWDQIAAHVRRDEPVMIPIRYDAVPLISRNSYSESVPARGRSDTGIVDAHMVVLHAIRGDVGIVADSDFGSPARPRTPPHSELPLAVVRGAWEKLGRWKVTYAVEAPPGSGTTPAVGPAVVAPTPASPEGADGLPPPAPRPGVTFRFGGRPKYRGQYTVRVPAGERANLRSSPHVRSDNVVGKATAGTTFACAQTSHAGTNVNGSSRWHGTADGERWLHTSVVRAVGHRTGTEEIR